MADDADPGLLAVLGEDEILQAIEDWRDQHPQEFIDLIGDVFDVGGQQQAVAAEPTKVEKVKRHDGKVAARVRFNVTYKNPIDETDTELSAENVTEDVFDLTFDATGSPVQRVSDLQSPPETPFPT